MIKFRDLLLPSYSSLAECYWVCVKDSNKWFLSKEGDIKFSITNNNNHNSQFYFDYESDALIAIIEYYRKHDKPFPHMKHISDRFTPPAFHRRLITIYGNDNMWWKK